MHYLTFVEHGLDMPSESDYDEVCKQCWVDEHLPKGLETDEEIDEDGAADTEDELGA